MGDYRQMETLINDRSVYEEQSGYYLYYSDYGYWCITSKRCDMEAGTSSGKLGVESNAETPDQISEVWEVLVRKSWQAAPSIHVKVKQQIVNDESQAVNMKGGVKDIHEGDAQKQARSAKAIADADEDLARALAFSMETPVGSSVSPTCSSSSSGTFDNDDDNNNRTAVADLAALGITVASSETTPANEPAMSAYENTLQKVRE
jgi:hypothetical protein